MIVSELDSSSEVPLYRQLFEQIRARIENGQLVPGERLPATRELASRLGLNRATVTAAYDLLASEGLATGHVGRGSFVLAKAKPGTRWQALLDPGVPQPLPVSARISFATSRPSEGLFPIDEFRESCEEVK
jgi:DNA-binding transcriptional regulator YhcF (GntR family)